MSYYPSRSSDVVGLDYINGDAINNYSIWANRFQHLLALARLNKDTLKLSARDIATNSWTKWEDFYKGHWDDKLLRGGYDLHREVLYNEIVIESDYPEYEDNFDATRIIGAILEKKGFIPHYYYSGSKSIHCLQNNERVIVKRHDGRIISTKLEHVHKMIQNNKTVSIKYKDKFIKILNTYKRQLNKDEKLVKIHCSDGNSLITSRDHLHLVLRDNKHQIVKADSITLKDRLIKDVNGFEGSDSGTYDLGRFLGLYLAEGCSYEKSHHLNFVFDITEQDYVDFLITFAKKMGAYCQFRIYKETNCIRVNIYSQALYYLTKEFLIGNTARSKGLTSKVFGMSIGFREGIIDGWLEGDGDHRKYQNGTTVSKGLADTLLRLALTVGRCFTKKSYTHKVDGLNRRYYKLRWIKKPHYTYKTNIIDPPTKCVYVKINYVCKVFKKKTALIDITIDSEDHLFSLAKGYITHNCHVYLDFAQLGKVDQILQDMIMQRYGSGNRFRKEFIEFVRGLMIRCWDTGIREFDEQLIHSSHLIRAEQSKNKKGYKTFLGHTYKDLSFVPKICNEDNRIYPVIGKIRISTEYDAQTLVEEFWNSIVIKDKKNKVRRRESALSKWSNPNAKEHLRYCVQFILSDRFSTADDGYKRAMFILINELKRIHSIDETMTILNDWNRRMGYPINDFKSHMNSKEYSLSCNYIHSFLETLGFNDVAVLCKGKIYK